MTTTETTAEIVPVAPAARVLASRTVMTLATLDDVARVAGIAARSGLARVSKPEEAAIILMTGMELGLTPMQSLRGIYIVEGRPVLAADTMVAIVTRSGACRYWRTIETTAERCTIETQRVDDDTIYRRAWTLDDAKRAGLVGKGTWAKYPAAMLRHRCAADLAREVYPEILLGMYDPDEISTDSIDAKPSPQRARVEVRPEAPALPAPVVVAPPAVDPRDLAPLGIEAPAQPAPRRAEVVADVPAVQIDATPEWQAAVNALPPSLASYCNAVERAALPGECVDAWMRHRAEVGSLATDERTAAWNALVLRAAFVGSMSVKSSRTWLNKAVKDRETPAQPAAEAQS